MTQEEILDYNKLCAEFLGWKKHENLNPAYFTSEKGGWWLRELVFHSDWIMEVVEAILYLDSGIYTVVITGNQCRISSDTLTYNETVALNSTKESVVQAINQFLIWYNENN